MATITPLDSFQHLTDNVPTWLTKLDELTIQVAEQNARFIRLSQSSTPMITKKKHNSTESLRPNDHCTEAQINHPTHNEEQKPEDTTMPPPPPTGSEPLYIPPNPSYKCLSHASRPKIAGQINVQPPLIPSTNRKRKPTSTHPSAMSEHAHPRYRTKSMIVVYYDSAIQDAFEALVRSIAGARNTLRKGKTTASFKARMASMGMDNDDPFAGPSEFAMLNPKRRGGLGRGGGPGLRDSPNSKMKEFEDADKNLDTAQSLCEVAAHQFLRDGDCRLEIEGTRKRFEAALDIARREVERLKEEEEEEREAKEAKEAEEKTLVPTEEKLDERTPVVEIMQEKTIAPEPIKQVNLTGTGTIEIDDGSDVESVHIDMSAFRSNIRARRA